MYRGRGRKRMESLDSNIEPFAKKTCGLSRGHGRGKRGLSSRSTSQFNQETNVSLCNPLHDDDDFILASIEIPQTSCHPVPPSFPAQIRTSNLVPIGTPILHSTTHRVLQTPTIAPTQTRRSSVQVFDSEGNISPDFLHLTEAVMDDIATLEAKRDTADSSYLPDSVFLPSQVAPEGACTQSAVDKSFSVTERLLHTLQQNALHIKASPEAQKGRKNQAVAFLDDFAPNLASHAVGPFYGLPTQVKTLFQIHRKITKFYDWQEECLALPTIQQGRNLIYSLPTSGGKTLVAEILLLTEILCYKKNVLLVLPFVSIVQEKVRGLSPFAVGLDFIIEEYAGARGGFPVKKHIKRNTVYIATIEKASSIINSLIESSRLDEIGLIIVDELHMIGEASRGAILESLLTKLLFTSGTSIQIIGMSATLSNITELCTFLRAELYTSDFRPVEHTEFVKCEQQIFRVNTKTKVSEHLLQLDRIQPTQEQNRLLDPDNLTALVHEIIPGHSCLIFCATKKNCQSVASLLSRLLPQTLKELKAKKKAELIEALLDDGGGFMCNVLEGTIPMGIAYHHSGLTVDERKLIEEAFLEGTLNVICCTSTLAAGVNLPAKRVILRSPYVAMDFLSRSQYKQMVGRAGRAGLDSSGESYLIIKGREKDRVRDLVDGPFSKCVSGLTANDMINLRSLLVTTIGLKITPTVISVFGLLQRTLYALQNPDEGELWKIVHSSVKCLIEKGLVCQQQKQGEDVELTITNLGRAVYKGSIDPDRAPELYADLMKAREALNVSNYLHLLYLVTPYEMAAQCRPDWMTYLKLITSLPEEELKVAYLVGVTEAYIVKRASGHHHLAKNCEAQVNRFYLSMVLYELWQQHLMWSVAERYQLTRGYLQQLLQGAAAFASCVSHFCQELEELWAYKDLMGNFVQRLSFCCSVELLSLLDIPGVKVGRARQLHAAGFNTLQKVAQAKPQTLVAKIKHMPRSLARQIITASQMILKERAEALQEEAETMVVVPAPAEDEDIPTEED